LRFPAGWLGHLPGLVASLEDQPHEQGLDGDQPEDAGRLGMAIAFWTYLVFIVAGLAYFSVIGLTHH
jgi:hypothetical protein